jgi:hypothetical protein
MATMLDLSEPGPRRANRKDSPFSVDVSKEVHEEAVRRVQQTCKRVLADCVCLVEYNLLDYEQMNFVLRCERFFKDNKHLGIHWLKQLRQLTISKRSQLNESIMMSRFIG